MTIYLLRHGETTWNRAGRLQGHANSPLTLLGTRQAEAMGKLLERLLHGTAFHFWSSPQDRSRQTAAIICDVIGHDYEAVRFRDQLMDIALGDRDGYPGWRELARDFPEEAAARRKDPWRYRHPNGESSQCVQERVTPLLSEWIRTGGVHVAVSHGVPIKILRGLYTGLSESETYDLDRPQNAIFRLQGGQIEEIGIGLP